MSSGFYIRVGELYRNRDGHTVQIVTKIDSSCAPYFHKSHEDAPFVGYNQNTGEWDAYSITGYSNPYEQTDKDLVDGVNPSPILPDITLDDIAVGLIAATINDHQAVDGRLKGWTLTSRFEISEAMIKGMFDLATVDIHIVLTDDSDRMIDKTAYAILINCNNDYPNEVESVMVVYRYDSSYYTATLNVPK